MLKCTYCGRILKQHYSICPGCGASSFTEIESMNNLIIETPPKGGYKINLGQPNKEEKKSDKKILWIIIGIILICVSPALLPLILGLVSGNAGNIIFALGFILVPVVAIAPVLFAIKGIEKTWEEKQNIEFEKRKKLAATGILIKNIDYELEASPLNTDDIQMYVMKINYVTKDGREITCEKLYDGKMLKDDGKADLLIDPDDYTNYYIDFEIY